MLLLALICIHTPIFRFRLPKLRAADPNSVEVITSWEFPNPGSQPADGVVEKYALVVGVTDYTLNPDLEYTDDDAYSWADYLESIGYEVKLLTGYVDASTLERELYFLLETEDGDDYVAFIFAGHGVNFFFLYSAIVLSGWPLDTAISQYALKDIFSYADSKHIFFFFDACQIGGMSTLVTSSERYAAMASDMIHTAIEDSSLGHGAFTYFFLIEGIIRSDYKYMEQAFDYAYDECKKRSMNPTEADGDPESYFALYPVSGSGGGGGGDFFYEIK